MIVKICGLRSAEHALAAAAAGTDLVGLVFAPSRRRVSVEEAIVIAAALRGCVHRPLIAGLFVNAPPTEVAAVARAVGLDLAQLSGDEPSDDADALSLPLIKALRMDGSAREAAWIERAVESTRRQGAKQTRSQADSSYLPKSALSLPVSPPSSLPVSLPHLTLLIDAHVPGAYGGTGVTADWSRAATLARSLPLILAGGLTPENVGAAIAAVRPVGVDVSSGVERDGVKDTAKIEAFLGAARAAH